MSVLSFFHSFFSKSSHVRVPSENSLVLSGIRNLIDRIDRQGLSYLGVEALADLAKTVSAVEQKKLQGIFVETGCALGGSSIVITAAKTKSRRFYVYDVFGMIPPPSEKDGEKVHQRYQEITSGSSEGLKGNLYYGYEENLKDKVENSFNAYGFPVEKHHVELVPGLYQDSLHIDAPVAFAHIDCDWYDSVALCLDRIAPNIVSGGVMIIDDYYYYDGCKKAVDEFLAATPGTFFSEHNSRLHIFRK